MLPFIRDLCQGLGGPKPVLLEADDPSVIRRVAESLAITNDLRFHHFVGLPFQFTSRFNPRAVRIDSEGIGPVESEVWDRLDQKWLEQLEVSGPCLVWFDEIEVVMLTPDRLEFFCDLFTPGGLFDRSQDRGVYVAAAVYSGKGLGDLPSEAGGLFHVVSSRRGEERELYSRWRDREHWPSVLGDLSIPGR